MLFCEHDVATAFVNSLVICTRSSQQDQSPFQLTELCKLKKKPHKENFKKREHESGTGSYWRCLAEVTGEITSGHNWNAQIHVRHYQKLKHTLSSKYINTFMYPIGTPPFKVPFLSVLSYSYLNIFVFSVHSVSLSVSNTQMQNHSVQS